MFRCQRPLAVWPLLESAIMDGVGPDRTRAVEPDATTPRPATPVVDQQSVTSNAATAQAVQGAAPLSAAFGTLTAGGNQAVARLAQSSAAPATTRVAFVREEGLNLRSTAEPGGSAVAQLPIGRRVHVLDDVGQPTWSRVAVLDQTGYVVSSGLHLPPDQLIQSDPGLAMIRVKPGQTFWGLVKETYGITGGEGPADQNINRFINAIRAVNKPEAFRVKTGVVDDIGNAVVPGRDASDTELIAGVDLWIPSFRVAAAMNVGSGTVSGEVTRMVTVIQQTINDFAGACAASVKYAPASVAAQCGQMALGLLDGLVQFAKEAAVVLAASTAAGALLGSLFGGVGAIPGAEIGFELGLLVLEYYGLYMLIEAIMAVGKQLLSQLGQFVALAWQAKGDPKKVDQAGKALADALGLMAAAVLTVLAAYLLKEGAAAFSKTRFAAKLGQQPIAKWLAERSRGETFERTTAPTSSAGREAPTSSAGREAPPSAAGREAPPAAAVAGNPIQQVVDEINTGRQAGAGRPVARVLEDNSVQVRAEGVVGDPVPRRGYEDFSNPGSVYNLPEYQRAHMYGPGFGDELADGIMLVHKNVNLKLQNQGVEKAIRKLHKIAADEGGQVVVNVSVTSHPRTAGGPLLLKEANYRVSLRHPDGKLEVAFEVDIGEIGLPGRPSATNAPVSVTPRGVDAAELAELLKN